MSRLSKKFIIIPKNVLVKFNNRFIFISGNNGSLLFYINKFINYKLQNNKLFFFPCEIKKNWFMVGTIYSLINNMIIGVTEGFFKKLLLVGVGYRAFIKFNKLILFLGFSHYIDFVIPLNINIICLHQTEILIKGCNKQLVGQVAANLLKLRKFESYKGKGIRYYNKIVILKEVKKKK